MKRQSITPLLGALALLSTISLAGAPAAAQETRASAQSVTPNTSRLPADAPRPAITIDAAGWLRGQYLGTGLGGEVELSFLPARAGAMVGSFRLLRNERSEFSEHLQMVEVDGTLQLRVKHFTPDLVGWEEKDKYLTFRFVEGRDNELRFDGLTYRRTDDGLQIFIAMRSKGELREQQLTLRRLQ